MLRQNVSALLLAPIRIQVSVGLPLAKDIHNIGRKKKITQQQDWLFLSITISNLMLTTQNRAMILALKFDSDPSEINDKSLKYSFARLNLLRKFVSNFQIENRFCNFAYLCLIFAEHDITFENHHDRCKKQLAWLACQCYFFTRCAMGR